MGCYIGKELKNLVNIELEILQSHKNENIHLWQFIVSKQTPAIFFKYAKKFVKSNTEVGPLLNASGDLVKDKTSMSNMLLKQFSSVFSSPSRNYVIKEPTSFFYDHDESNSSMSPELTDITFTKEIVESTRGRASRWPEATQTAVGPAKAIFWLALLASHNFVQALT